VLSEDELYDWMAMYSLDPWGAERNDMANAVTAAMIANVNRDPRKGKPISPGDLMPKWGMAAEEEKTPEQVKQQLLAQFGHRIKRKEAPSE
jgi:hypothetical protein